MRWMYYNCSRRCLACEGDSEAYRSCRTLVAIGNRKISEVHDHYLNTSIAAYPDEKSIFLAFIILPQPPRLCPLETPVLGSDEALKHSI